MREAVICEPLRTPVGRYGGVFRDVPVHELGGTVVRGLVERSGIPPEAVDCLTAAVEIPMVGVGASLNVAVAGTLVLYRLAGLA